VTGGDGEGSEIIGHRSRGHEVSQAPVRFSILLAVSLAQEIKARPDPLARVVLVQFDIVADAVGGKNP
jgi:hypothetical protein